ncbi:MAG: hypothetical protein A3F90_00440 [Deltaproteobacteria bacterium RIFCSPLOWO2_12_FULL_60_19]|nr:MAG: hypothetical protein A3F90_00440 [Deltaproteobacteria bacterium RIFCSPLOWO2_12_FULL_60_19]
MARAVGIERVFEIDSVEALHGQFDKIVLQPGHTFTVLEVEPLREKPGGVPIGDVESKFRYGRYIERTAGIKIFRHPALERLNPYFSEAGDESFLPSDFSLSILTTARRLLLFI